MPTITRSDVWNLTKRDYVAGCRELSAEAGVTDTLHAYFMQQHDRLFRSCQIFNLFRNNLGHVLEVGPFYGYTPFLLRQNSASYTVLEGDDPAGYALKPLYQKHDITAHYLDLFECFGSTDSARRTFDFEANSFDSILCWETMEHFNFNPVPFVRELHRVLKPGGAVYITVPNKASLQNIVALLSGRFEKTNVDAYYTFESYRVHGKTGFYGFHWREYSPVELAYLFEKAGFIVRKCSSFVAFQFHERISTSRLLVRAASRVLARTFRRYGTNVYLVAEKQN